MTYIWRNRRIFSFWLKWGERGGNDLRRDDLRRRCWDDLRRRQGQRTNHNLDFLHRLSAWPPASRHRPASQSKFNFGPAFRGSRCEFMGLHTLQAFGPRVNRIEYCASADELSGEVVPRLYSRQFRLSYLG